MVSFFSILLGNLYFLKGAQITVTERKSANKSNHQQSQNTRAGDEVEAVDESKRVRLKTNAAAYKPDRAASRRGNAG